MDDVFLAWTQHKTGKKLENLEELKDGVILCEIFCQLFNVKESEMQIDRNKSDEQKSNNLKTLFKYSKEKQINMEDLKEEGKIISQNCSAHLFRSKRITDKKI